MPLLWQITHGIEYPESPESTVLAAPLLQLHGSADRHQPSPATHASVQMTCWQHIGACLICYAHRACCHKDASWRQSMYLSCSSESFWVIPHQLCRTNKLTGGQRKFGCNKHTTCTCSPSSGASEAEPAAISVALRFLVVLLGDACGQPVGSDGHETRWQIHKFESSNCVPSYWHPSVVLDQEPPQGPTGCQTRRNYRYNMSTLHWGRAIICARCGAAYLCSAY